MPVPCTFAMWYYIAVALRIHTKIIFMAVEVDDIFFLILWGRPIRKIVNLAKSLSLSEIKPQFALTQMHSPPSSHCRILFWDSSLRFMCLWLTYPTSCLSRPSSLPPSLSAFLVTPLYVTYLTYHRPLSWSLSVLGEKFSHRVSYALLGIYIRSIYST
jgi:hypothetical protein